MVKSLLDLANGFLTLLNTPIGTFVTQVTLLTSALFGLQQLIGAMNIFKTIGAQIANLPALFSALTGAIKGTTTAATLFGTALNTAFPIVAAISAALVIIPKIVDAVTVSLDEQKEIVNELNSEIDGYNSEIEELESKQANEGLTIAEQNRLDILKQQLAVKQKLYKLKLQQQYDMEQDGLSGQYDASFYAIDNALNAMKDAKNTIDSLDTSMASNADSVDLWTRHYEDNLQVVLNHADALAEDYQRALDYQEAGIKLSEADQRLLEEYPKLLEFLKEIGILTEDTSEGASNLASSIGDAESAIEYSTSSLSKLQDAYDALSSAVEEYNTNGGFTIDTIDELLSLDSEYLNMLTTENGKLVLNSQALYDKAEQLKQNAIQERIAALSAELYAIATEGAKVAADNAGASVSDASNSLSVWDRVVRDAALGTLGLTEAISSLDIAMEADPNNNWLGLTQQQRAAMEDAINNARDYIDTVSKFTLTAPGASDKATSQAEKTADIIAEQTDLFKEQIEILEHELFLLEKVGASDEERIAKLQEIQAALHDQANWYRDQGLDDNSEYIRDLQQQWWGFNDDIQDIYDEQAEAAKEAAEEAEQAWEDALNAQIDALNEQKDAYETAFNYIVKQIEKESMRLMNKEMPKKSFGTIRYKLLRTKTMLLMNRLLCKKSNKL